MRKIKTSQNGEIVREFYVQKVLPPDGKTQYKKGLFLNGFKTSIFKILNRYG